MVGAIEVAHKELKAEFVTEQELHCLLAKQINGPTEDSLENNIRYYLHQNRGYV